jgi:hypothetical protein
VNHLEGMKSHKIPREKGIQMEGFLLFSDGKIYT